MSKYLKFGIIFQPFVWMLRINRKHGESDAPYPHKYNVWIGPFVFWVYT